MKFLNEVCRLQFTAANQYHERTKAVYFHTSHPGLCAALRRDKRWVQVSQMVGGESKLGSIQRLAKSRKRQGKENQFASGYGGHHRAVQGFKMQRALAV